MYMVWKIIDYISSVMCYLGSTTVCRYREQYHLGHESIVIDTFMLVRVTY